MLAFRRVVGDVQSGDSYALVLALLLASLLVSIITPEETWAGVVRDVVVSATVVIAYWTSTARRAFLVPRVVLPSILLVFVVVGAIEGATTQAISAAIGAAVVGGVSYLVTRDLVDRRRVDVQTVLGSLCLYVLLGFFFGLLYSLAAELGDAAFFTRGDDGTTGERLYFSFVAITTTGFGDLAPATDLGRALSVFEIVLGQLYLVTVVAVLVTAATGRQLILGHREHLDDRRRGWRLHLAVV